jgi:hypothetical protein
VFLRPWPPAAATNEAPSDGAGEEALAPSETEPVEGE